MLGGVEIYTKGKHGYSGSKCKKKVVAQMNNFLLIP